MFLNHVLVLLRSAHAVHFEDVYAHYSTDQSIDPSTNQWSKLLHLRAVLECGRGQCQALSVCATSAQQVLTVSLQTSPLSLQHFLFIPLNFELWTQCMVSCIWLSVHLQTSSLLLLLSPVNSLVLPWLASLSYNPPPHHTHTHTRCKGHFGPIVSTSGSSPSSDK